jgi:hypothetical protein
VTKDKKTNLPAVRPKTGLSKTRAPKGEGGFLAKVRAAKATAPALTRGKPTKGDPKLVDVALKPRDTRPRLVLAIDATASREPAWAAATATTDALFEVLPGELDVALAAHGGSRVTLFTGFTSTPAVLRDQAAAVRCAAGMTRMVQILERCRDVGDVRVVVYVGDVFEESLEDAERVAASLRLRGTRVIVLHDRAQAPAGDVSAEAFQRIAKITEGAVLPFDAAALGQLRDILHAIAALAVGGVKLLQARAPELPEAARLLKQLSDGK